MSMWVRSSLLQMVLPSSNTSFTTDCLRRLACLLGVGPVSSRSWVEAVRGEVELAREVVELYFHVGLDYVRLEGDGEHGDVGDELPCVPGHLLVLVLFLQGVGRRKVVGEKRERKTEEEVLTQYVVQRMMDLQEIFTDRKTFLLVLGIIIEMKSGHVEDLDLTNLSSFLIPDPHGVVSCIKSGKKLVWTMGGILPNSKAKMATTAHIPGVKKMIVLSMLVKQTLAKNSGTLSGAMVSLHRSRLSHIYLTTWLDSILINKCTSSTIFTGPVRNTVKMTGCKNITMVTMARRIIMQECLDCTLIVFTPTRPVLSISCHNIIFAPFNTNYSGIEDDMIQAGLSKESSNQWNSPVMMSSTTRQVFSILHPTKFDTFCLPFSSYLATTFIPLPMEYDMAVRGKQQLVKEWEVKKLEACLTSQEDDLLESLVKKEYNVFLESYSLQTSGLKHLAGLIK